MVRTIAFLLLFLSSTSIAQQKKTVSSFGKWHETHGLDKFPCMNEKETKYFQRLISVERNDEKKKILAQHRRQVLPSSRMPASVQPQKMTKYNFICPPFRGVRNPYPQVKEFGKASTFERIHISDNSMSILNGLSHNQKWPTQYNTKKGYFEGKSQGGTPFNIIPMVPPSGENVRFIVQYLIWQDKTPPSLTICYREDLHKQCNPYPDPATVEKIPEPATKTAQVNSK